MKNKNGITLIALIITIIVMLILVGVSVSVTLNGGLFSTAKKAVNQTEISMIKEQLEIQKALVISENKGNIPLDYGINMDNLEISNELKDKYRDKLVISKDGILYYNSANLTPEEIVALEEMGVYEYIQSDVIAENWVTDGNGKIIYYKGPEVETLVIPSQINDEKITSIDVLALSGISFQRNEDYTLVLDQDGNPIPLEEQPTGVTSKIKYITLEAGIQEIDMMTFAYCTALQTINLPETVITIGESCFGGCTSLTSINIPKNVKYIGDYLFYECSSLNNVTIEEGVETIGDHAFAYCSNISNLIIPASVANIIDSAFYGCKNLQNVYFKQTEAPTFGSGCFRKESGEIITFYFKNDTVYNALTTSHYNSLYGNKSDDYTWQ